MGRGVAPLTDPSSVGRPNSPRPLPDKTGEFDFSLLMPPVGTMDFGTSPSDVASSNLDVLMKASKQTPQETAEEKRASAWGRDGCHGEFLPSTHVVLTTHPRRGCPIKIKWGAKTPEERGPVIASITQPKLKNAIGTHNGSYSVYRSIAVAAGKMDPFFRPDLHNTAPPVDIPPSPSWFDPTKMVSMDPWGHLTTSAFGSHLKDGVDVRPTIAITKAHIQMPETKEAMELGRIVLMAIFSLQMAHAWSPRLLWSTCGTFQAWQSASILPRLRCGAACLSRLVACSLNSSRDRTLRLSCPPLVARPSTSLAILIIAAMSPRCARYASMMNATARTCSDRTSAHAGHTSSTVLRSVSRRHSRVASAL